MNFSYVLWHQQKQEENGGILTYSQTFLTGDGAGAILDTTDAQNVPETPDTDPYWWMQWSVQMWQKIQDAETDGAESSILAQNSRQMKVRTQKLQTKKFMVQMLQKQKKTFRLSEKK